MAKRIGFLTTRSLGITPDDRLVATLLEQQQHSVLPLDWRSEIDAQRFDMIVVRSTWDYHLAPQEFVQVVDRLSQTTEIANPADMLRWNLSKDYLLALQDAGVPIVPTRLIDIGRRDQLRAMLTTFDTDSLVVKPIVGASAHHIMRINESHIDRAQLPDHDGGALGEYLVQPFCASVVSSGEFSLFYFDGKLSHAVQKKPAKDDFRVQEEFGGRATPCRVPESLQAAGDRVISALDSAPLYARVDMVEADTPDTFWLMELELIEPALYLVTDPQAPQRFASAILHRLDGPGTVS